MKKFFYLVAMATIVMTSCSKNDEMKESQAPEDLRIKFGTGTMNIDMKTRGPVNLLQQIADVQLVRVPDYSIDAEWNTTSVAVATTATANWNTAAGNYDLTVAADQYYNADPDFKSEFTAYAPAATFVAADGFFPTATWTIDGKTDILVSSSVANGTKATATPLHFLLDHKLLQLRFFLMAENEAAQEAWGNVTGIEILDSPVTAVATLPEATMDFPGGEDIADIPVYIYETDDKLLETNNNSIVLGTVAPSTEQAYVMVAPTTVASNNTFKIKVYTVNNANGTELTVTLNNTLGSLVAAGESYAITLTFKATLITFAADLAKWRTTGNTGAATVE